LSFSITQELIRSGELVLWHRYDRRTFLDQSDQGNDGVPANAWYGNKGLQFGNATGVVVAADAAELQLTAGTLFVSGDFRVLERADESYLISKRDAGGTNYDWRLDNTPQMEFFDGANTRTLAHDYRGDRSLAVTFTNGAAPNGYADGALVGAFNDTVAITVDDADVSIGNDFNTNRSVLNPLWNVLIINVVMTAADILTLHQEMLRIMRGSEL
jgi:hypothetical protein